MFVGYVDEKKKISQYVLFSDGGVHINRSLKKIGTILKLQTSLLKQEMERDRIHEDTWEARENEWLPYVRNYVLSFAFCYVRYTKGMEELTDFGMENSLTLPFLANKFLIV